MKVVALNGSPRKSGNTFHSLNIVLEEVSKEGVDTEIIHLGKMKITGCTACSACIKNKDEKCIINDGLDDVIQQLKNADGILLGSPVYYSGINGTMKSALDRIFYVAGANDSMFRHKVGAAVVAVRRSGGLPTFQQLNNYLLYSEMMIPTSNYWNVAHGLRPGEVEQDDEGKQIMRILGKNMAYLLKLKEHGKEAVQPPEPERKVYTHFVR